MSLTSIMQTGLSALTANQQALKATSTNVANVNTAGYSRLDVQFVSREAVGGVAGVQVDIKRVSNAYLAAAEMRGSSEVSSAQVLADFMDRAQSLLGDPSQSGSVFATLDPVFSSFGSLSIDPSSALRRSESLSNVQTLLSQLQATSTELSALRSEANSRAVGVMEEANSLLTGIANLNKTIQNATISGASAADAQTEQQGMVDRLSEIMDIRVQQRPLGGVEVRTTDGLILADLDAATLGMSSTANGEAYPAAVMIPPRATNEVQLDTHLNGGELKGLLKARDSDVVDLQQQFGEYAAGVANALNAAHNATSSVPPPASMTGRDTGLVSTDRLNFTGATNIALVNNDGTLTHNYRVDFGAGTITDEGGTVTNFANSIGDFQTALNTALGADGTATFAGGSLKLTSSLASTGIAITDDPDTPASRAGAGFSMTFGLNDLGHEGRGAQLCDRPVQRRPERLYRRPDDEIRGAQCRRRDHQDDQLHGWRRTTISALRADIDTALSGYAQTSLDANGRLSIQPTNNAVATYRRAAGRHRARRYQHVAVADLWPGPDIACRAGLGSENSRRHLRPIPTCSARRRLIWRASLQARSFWRPETGAARWRLRRPVQRRKPSSVPAR